MQKKAPHTVISIGAFQSFSVDDMRERKCFGMKTNKCGQVKTKTKTWRKIFCFVSLEQQGYLKNALVASGPQIYTFVFRCRWAFGVVLWELVTLGTLTKVMMFS